MKRSYSIILPLAASCGLALSSYGGDIVNDTWIDGTRTDPASPVYSENGVDADLDGNLESAWFTSGTGATIPTSPGHMVLTMGTSSASWTSYVTPEASPVTLANAGDQVKVTWIFTPSSVNTLNTSQNFRFAFVDSPSASRITADSTTPGSAVYAGYSLFMNMGQTLGNGNPFQLRERDGSSSALLSSTAPWLILGNGATSGNHGYDSGTAYTLVMSLTRNGAGGLDIDAIMSGGTLDGDGTAEVLFTDTTPNSFTYDTAAIRPTDAGTTASSFDTTLFKVEFIPEPSTFALAALGILGAALARRQSRQ